MVASAVEKQQERGDVMTRTGIALALASLSCVAVAGPPTVQPVDVTVTNPVLPVEVSNAYPIPVSVTSMPAASSDLTTRHQITFSNSAWDSTTVGTSLIRSSNLEIPSDKVFVLEYAYAEARINPGESVFLSITCQGAGASIGTMAIAIPLTSAGVFATKEFFVGGGPAKCYTGSSAIATLLRNSTASVGSAFSSVSLGGYLIDKPQ